MDVTYSIIIPHKDIPDLLQRCLDSIPQREDVQVIVVDDNSDPRKVDFAHFPGLDRADVESYFTKEGKGAGYARNVGLQHARGRWLLFADADDFFHDGMLQMLDKWKDSDHDIVFFKTDSVDCYTLEKRPGRNRYIDYNNIECLRYYTFAPWGKMIQQALVRNHNILFDEVMASNDVMFSVLCGDHSNHIVVDDNIIYCSTIRWNSLVYEENYLSGFSRLRVAIRVNKYLCDKGISKDDRGSSIRYLLEIRKFGRRKYLIAFFYFVSHERLPIVCRFAFNMIRFNIRRFC